MPRRTVTDNYEYLFGSKTKVIRPKRRLTNDDGKWKFICFVGGIRIIKYPLAWDEAKVLRQTYTERGLKCAIAHRLKGNFPPKGTAEAGQLWCGYCRAYRFFKVLKSDPIYGPEGVPVCPYCLASIDDPDVIRWNGEQLVKRKSRAAIRRKRMQKTRRLSRRFRS